MSLILNNSDYPLQEQSESLANAEHFALFKIPHGLGKGIKARIRSLGCIWNNLLRGWLCHIAKQEEVQTAFQNAKLQTERKIVLLPKGSIHHDPKIASRQVRLEIMEEQNEKEARRLLQDVCNYDVLRRPEEFTEPPSAEGKTSEQYRKEMDFFTRFSDLQKSKGESNKAREELLHLTTDPGEKVLDHEAPLLIADAIIQEHFLFQENRTLQYCSEIFWKWDGIKYSEMSESGMRQIVYNFLRDAKKRDDLGFLENFNPNKSKVDQIIDALKAICHKDQSPILGVFWLDGRKEPNPTHLICFQNGLLNIED